MSWTCANCGFENDDASIRCAVCPSMRRARLVLTSSENNSWRTLIDADVTRRTYRHLYPGEEHQYVPRNEGEHPFSVSRNRQDEWWLIPNPASPICTTLNGTVCESGISYPLQPGNVIGITPREHPGAIYAPLTVSMVAV